MDCKVLVVEAGAKIHGKLTMRGIDIELPKTDKKPGLIRRSSKESEDEAMSS